jgi:glycyl-tRNA synthetase (class II)
MQKRSEISRLKSEILRLREFPMTFFEHFVRNRADSMGHVTLFKENSLSGASNLLSLHCTLPGETRNCPVLTKAAHYLLNGLHFSGIVHSIQRNDMMA